MTEQEDASQAWNHFKKKEYSESNGILNRLKSTGLSLPDEIKLRHNQAILDYLQKGEKEPQQLFDELSKIKVSLDSKIEEQESEGDSLIFMLEEIDSFFISFNQAVLLHQMKQYGSALSILESLFQNIDGIDELLALKICFLLIEIHIKLHQTENIDNILSWIEKTFKHLSNDRDFSQEDGKTADEIEKEGEQEKIQQNHVNSTEIFETSLKEFQHLFHLYKVKNSLLKQNPSSTNEEIKKIEKNEKDSIIFLKANLEYIQKNFHESLKILKTIKQHDQQTEALYFADIGAINFQLKKYNLASFYFMKALKAYEKLGAEFKNLPTFSVIKKLEVLYNLGHQHLLCNRPESAFQCFQQASKMAYNQPELWVRLAECCVLMHVELLSQSNQKLRNNFVKDVIGTGQSKKILLPTADFKRGLKLKEETPSSLKEEPERTPATPDNKEVTMSIEYALKCIRNALFLFSSKTKLSEQEEKLKENALLIGSYLALTGYDPVVALSFTRQLLSKNLLDPKLRILANIYTAEALCWLNQPLEAAQYLSPESIGLNEQTENSGDSLFTLYVNLAVVHITKNDLLQAQNCIKKALDIYPGTQALLLQIYLELRKGNTEIALQILHHPEKNFDFSNAQKIE